MKKIMLISVSVLLICLIGLASAKVGPTKLHIGESLSEEDYSIKFVKTMSVCKTCYGCPCYNKAIVEVYMNNELITTHSLSENEEQKDSATGITIKLHELELGENPKTDAVATLSLDASNPTPQYGFGYDGPKYRGSQYVNEAGRLLFELNNNGRPVDVPLTANFYIISIPSDHLDIKNELIGSDTINSLAINEEHVFEIEWVPEEVGYYLLKTIVTDNSGEGINVERANGAQILEGENGDEIVCTDSDGGKNYNSLGTVQNNTFIEADRCLGNNELAEYYCFNNKPAREVYVCPYKCIDGACITEGSGIPFTKLSELAFSSISIEFEPENNPIKINYKFTVKNICDLGHGWCGSESDTFSVYSQIPELSIYEDTTSCGSPLKVGETCSFTGYGYRSDDKPISYGKYTLIAKIEEHDGSDEHYWEDIILFSEICMNFDCICTHTSDA